MAKKRKVELPALTNHYVLRIEANGTLYYGEGASFDAAVGTLPQFQVFTPVRLSLTYNGKDSRPVLFTIPQFKRLFYPGLSGETQRSVLRKRLEMLL